VLICVFRGCFTVTDINDFAAVHAALVQPWSNGQTEITKLKLVKRQMYGRAKIDLVCTENLIRVDDVMESPKLAK
jgi:transposase